MITSLLCCLLAAAAPPVSTIFYNAHVFNVGGGTAIAVSGDKIVVVGDQATILSQKQPTTQLIDLHGAFLMPGFNDAHVHLAAAGFTRLEIDLTGADSLAEMLRRIRAGAAAAPPGQWIQGDGWDHLLWQSKTLPTRQDLDAVTLGHPAIFGRIDGHISVANSAAFAAAGLTEQTPDPQGGAFDHGPDGKLTGIVREEPALGMIRRHIPPPSPEMRKKALLLALQDAAAHGVTSAQDFSDWDDFLALEQLERENQLPIRVSEWLRFDDPVNVLVAHRAAHPLDDRMLHTGMLKGFMDGSLGSHTAAMLAPYADDPSNSGLPRYSQKALNAIAKERSALGFQIGLHAIGDRGVEMALDAFAATGSTGHRNRIEHSQVVAPQDIARYKQLGVIASMQPSHLLTDMNWAKARLGPERARYSYAWKDFLDAQVPLAFGTDYPVEPINPLRGVYAGVTRANETGTATYFAENKLTIQQVISAYTEGSAFAEFTEKWKGRIAPGYVADFVVLDHNITQIPPAVLLKTRVLRTVVGGKTVYQAPIP
jgi:predicted amidohydrolase YtcJ